METKEKEFNPARYFGMTIFQEAKLKEKDGFGYRASRYFVFDLDKKYSWNSLRITYGIRWSDNIQYFPIRNTSHNQQRSLSFGVWKLYFEIAYYRKRSFNQKQTMFLGRKIHQLLF